MRPRPAIQKSPPAHLSGREKALWQLCFQKGGVTAEIRRIVRSWHGTFQPHQIRTALLRRYPGIDVPTSQLYDTLEQLERWNKIVCVCEDSNGKVYQPGKYQPYRIVHHDRDGRVHRVTTVTVENPNQLQLEV